MPVKMKILTLGFVLLSSFAMLTNAGACTHITLKGADGTIVSGRTMEWESFDMLPQFHAIPRGNKISSLPMPDNKAGLTWEAKYGFVGIDVLGLTYSDALNEKGLSALMLYFPGSAGYQQYDPARASTSITTGDLVKWVVSSFETVAQVREALPAMQVASFSHPAVGGQVDMHWAIADATGEQIVVEYVGGELHIYDAPLGTMTNSPPYDWHLTNLRNYINMRPVAWPDMDIAGMELKPIGVGTGMLGLPGDITPPSRFIRAVAFSQTARKTTGDYDTVRELFRILDNFNVPVEKVNPEELKAAGLVPIRFSGTQYTTGHDLKNLVLYYHTDDNRSVRKVDLKAMDFGSFEKPYSTPLREDDPGIIDVTPK